LIVAFICFRICNNNNNSSNNHNPNITQCICYKTAVNACCK
jgi:hypothetical protein